MNFRIAITLFLVSVLTACGGENGGSASAPSYSGKTTAADITTGNAAEISAGASAGTVQSVADQSAQNAATSLRPSSESAFIDGFSKLLIERLNLSARLANQPAPGICDSGSADFTQSGNVITLVLVGCVSEGAVINGTVTVTGSYPTSFSMNFSNVSVSIDGQTYQINISLSCSGTSCSWSSDFVGANGKVYRVVNADISEAGGIFDITARIYHPDHGYVDVVANNVTFNSCTGGVPNNGSMALSGGSGSALVSFDSCIEFTVTVNSVATTYQWADYL